MSGGPILFYGVKEEYGCFSNFSRHAIHLDGHRWPTSEHYFQAQKFAGTQHAVAVRQARTPMLAAQMGRDRKRPLRRDWESVKDGVIRTLVNFQGNRGSFTMPVWGDKNHLALVSYQMLPAKDNGATQ